MKKLHLVGASALVVAMSFSGAAEAVTPFKGWSVGLQGGWNQDRVDFDFSVNELDSKQTYNTGFGGVYFDWTTSDANSFLFGLGFGVGYGFGSTNNKLFERKAAVGADTFVGKLESKLKRGFYGELNTRLGWNFDNKWSLYAVLAARAQSVEYKTTLTSNGGRLDGEVIQGKSRSDSDVLYAFGPGVGFDVSVNKAWSVGAQYRYFFENSVKAKLNNAESSYKARSHNALIRVSYHF